MKDVQLFENDPIQQNNHRLELTGDLVQHGRVYRLGERLANSASLWDQQQLEQPYRLDNRVAVNTDKIIIKRKRITSSSSSTKGLKDTKERGAMKKEKEAMKKEKEAKKKRKSKVRWFIKKMIFFSFKMTF